jgi:hypothetical protein
MSLSGELKVESSKEVQARNELWNMKVAQYVGLLQKGESHNITDVYEKFKEPFSHLNRFINIAISYDVVMAPKTKIVTTSFRFQTQHGSSNYGFLYCRKDKVVEPLFILGAPSLQSQDGEYRGRVIDYRQFTAMYEHNISALSQLEEYLLPKIASGELTLDFTIHCDTGISKLRAHIENTRLALKLYIACWLRDVTYIRYSVEENHLNSLYKSLMNTPENITIYDKFENTVEKNTIINLINRFIKVYEELDERDTVLIKPEVGHKLTPLSVSAITHVNDPRKSSWRELQFSMLVSNLVLNLISPGFSVMYNWITTAGGADIYDNSEMHAMYSNSTDIKSVKDKLSVDIDDSISANKKLIGYINRAEVYSDESLIFTDRSLVTFSESVGITFKDIPRIASSEFLKNNELRLVFTDLSAFKSIVFQYLYALYCMNSHCGLMHTDLHMNNVTIYRLYRGLRIDGTRVLPLGKILFTLAEKNYVFDFLGLYSCIIDFSRGIYCGDFAEKPMQLPHDFYDKQVDRVAAYIYSLFPDFFTEHKNTILSHIMTDLPQTFKLCTIFDAYTLITNIANRVDADPHLQNAMVPPKELVDWIHNLQSEVKKVVDATLNNLVGIGFATEIEWPILTLIEKMFSDVVVPSEKLPDLIIVDIFNSNFKQKIDLYDPSTHGPIFSYQIALDKYEEIMGHKPQIHDHIVSLLYQPDESAQFAEMSKDANATEPLEYPEWMFR